MNQQDLFNRLVNLLNEAAIDDTCWPETSKLMDRVYGAKGSILAFGDDFSIGEIEIFFTKCYYHGEERSDWLQEYFQFYYSSDERLPRIKKLPDSKIMRVVDLFSKKELKTSPTYNEALPRFETQNGLNVRLDGPSGSGIALGIADPIDSSGWSLPQINLIKGVLPHLRQYVRVHSALAEARALGASLSELLNNTHAGVILLDRRGLIVDMNDTARGMFRRSSGLSSKAGSLHAIRQKDNSRLEELLTQALPRFGELAKSGSMMVRQSSPLPMLALHVKPVASREEAFRSRHVAALVLIIDPVNWVRIKPELVKEVLGLTPSEVEIAICLTEGKSIRQIAAATGRSYDTVRFHLRHIFTKLGVSRQIEVAQAVLALSHLPAPRN